MTVFYNEIDPYCAQWLRNLIAAGHIAPGVVDERSIEDITPDELREYTQCHFFAGIGVWSYALRLAGWPDDRPVWTGSCPCQPFSAAGKGAGFADERHLWPAWQHLINQCRPPVVFGEQVASKAVDAWIDLVHADLEGMGYAFGCVPFPAAGVGAPHIRDRTFWVGDADCARLEGRAGHGGAAGWEGSAGSIAEAGVSGGLADTDGRNTSAERQQRSGEQRQQPQDGGACWLANAERADVRGGGLGAIATAPSGVQGANGERQWLRPDAWAGGSALDGARPGPTNGFWRDADWLGCTDGKWRPVEPSTFPLAHGATSRVGRLRAYGNAIVATAAEEMIRAYMEARQVERARAAA